MLRLAAETAAKGGDAADVLQAIDAQAKDFAVSAPALKAPALETALRAPGAAAADSQAVLEAALSAADEAQAADEYDAAGRLLRVVAAAATKIGAKQMATMASERGRLIDAMQREYDNVKGDLATLKDKPDDPDAGLHFGRFLCFFKGDWERGLPLLAVGSDAKLRDLAKKDLNSPTAAADQAALADAWMDAADAETGTKGEQIQLHAYALYKQAAPQMTGPDKTRVDGRIKKLDAIAEKLAVPELKDAPAEAGWFVLFHSADPSIWDSDTNKGKNDFAVSLSKAPDGVKFLRLKQAVGKDFVIIPMTNDALKKQSDDGTFGWQGEASVALGAAHLGVYRLPLGDHPLGAVAVYHVAVGMNAIGWGFGHRTKIGTSQGYGWAGTSLPSTVFEIAVKAGPLTDAEAKHLLTKKMK